MQKTHEKIFVEKPVDLDYEKVMSDVYSLNGQLSDTEELRRRIFGIVGVGNGREKEYAINVIKKQLIEAKREATEKRAKEAMANLRKGKVKRGTVKELYKDLESD